MTKHGGPEKRAVAEPNIVLLSLVGSGVHGISLTEEHGAPGAAQDDLDLMGICVEPPEYVLGLNTFDQYVFRTQPEGVRSGPGDIDLNVYGLRKWMRLALKGNPTIITPLWSPEHHIYDQEWPGWQLRTQRDKFVSKSMLRQYLGYMTAQRDRMQGIRGGKDCNRPELVEAYGYDTKFAGHAVRLGHQGIELAADGKLTLPMVEWQRQMVIDVRTGKWTEQEVIDYVDSQVETLAYMVKRAKLPDLPDSAWANETLQFIYENWWYEKKTTTLLV